MTFQQLIKYFGNQTLVAKALKIRPHTVCGWRDRGIPLGRQAQIELATAGKLKATK